MSSTVETRKIDNSAEASEADARRASSVAPLIVALLSFWGALIYLYEWTTQRTGTFTYGLDDTYIHLALARNIGLHHVWGLNAGEFASATSSPLWTLVLGLLFRPIHSIMTAFVLNTILASTAIVQAWAVLRRYRFNAVVTTILLEYFVFIVPMPMLVLDGMEHLLHIVAVVGFLSLFGRVYADKASKVDHVLLYALSCLLPVVRYESLLMIVAAATCLVATRRFRAPAIMVVFAFAGVAAFSAYFVAHGGMILPNSVIVKATLSNTMGHSFRDMLHIMVKRRMVTIPYVFVLLILTAVVIKSLLPSRGHHAERTVLHRSGNLAILFVYAVMTVGHLIGVPDVYQTRYHAYIVAVGLLWPVPIALRQILDDRRAGLRIFSGMLGLRTALAGLTLALLVMRGINTQLVSMYASVNIHDQQVQMATFAKTFYPTSTVAVNDIGAVAFVGNVRTLDLIGLASGEVAKLRIRHAYNTAALNSLIVRNHVPLVMIFDTWFDDVHRAQPTIPSSWTKVGQLHIDHNVICSESDVSFYATSSTDVPKLASQLRAFAPQLPLRDTLTVLH